MLLSLEGRIWENLERAKNKKIFKFFVVYLQKFGNGAIVRKLITMSMFQKQL